MKRTIRMLFAAAVSVMAAACSVQELDLPDHTETHEKVKIQVVPSIQGMDEVQTKSSVTSGESAVKDINIFFYHKGLLVASNYVVTPAVASFLLNEGLEYNVYAVANVGKITPVDKESDFIKYKMSIGSAGFVSSMNSGGIPMAWQKEGYVVSKSVTQLPVALVRLVSKIRFKVDMQALAGLKVTSIRLCNAAGAVTPFTMNGHGGSKITAASEAINGDYATTSDLTTINNGGQIYFYALENCQGTLLSGNKDPWKKTPENISVANLCTYLEVNCEFQSGFALVGTITYRVYLGQDNCTNFDIIRNVDMGVTLCLTKNLDNVSWKIDPDVDYNGTLGSVRVAQGMHGTDDLYVGETVLLSISLNQYLKDFLGSGMTDCSLAVTDSDGDCSNFSFGKITSSDGSYYCEMTGVQATGRDLYELWLRDKNGKAITDLTLDDGDIVCSLPELLQGDGGKHTPTENILKPQDNVTPVVNGDPDYVYLYLADSHGRNLNCTQADGQYRFDISYFKSPVMTTAAKDIAVSKAPGGYSAFASSYSATFTKGTQMDRGPVFKATLKITNAGTNAALCRAMSNIYHIEDYHSGQNSLAELTFNAVNTVSTKANADFEIVKPKFYLADKSTFQPSNGYMIAGTTIIAAYNPSKIDFWADVIYVGKRKASTTSSIVDGTTLINFRSGASNPGYYLPMATRVYAYPYIADCSSAALQHTSPTAKGIVIEGKECNVFATDRIGSVAKLSETDLNKDYMRAEVGIRSTGGKDIIYDYSDLNGSFLRSDGSIGTSAEYNYTWGDDTYSYRGCGWYTGEGMTTIINANKDANVASATNYSGANVYNLMLRKPVKFNISWNSSLKAPEVTMSGNTFGATFKVYVGLVYTSSCTTANNTSASSTKHTYTVTTPASNTAVPTNVYTLTGESGSVYLPSYAVLENNFAHINKTYWHENCTNAINLKSNRFSQMAMPESAEYCITILVDNQTLWVPVEITKTNPTSSITASLYTLYSHTARGTYADTSSMTNPDGSSRGSDSNVSSQASKYTDYTKVTSTYSVKFTVLHDMYWNWYNM